MVTGVLGATGYAGAETARLLSAHPHVKKLMLSSVSFEGERIENVYPNFLGKISQKLLKPEEVIAGSDIVFSALPGGVGEAYAKDCVKKGISFIDLSADFRFDDDEETYTAWYGKPYLHPELRKYSVYGLPELNRDKIKKLKSSGPVIIGNPGCYPTGASLGAFPALVKTMFADAVLGTSFIIVDSISGISGGGREPQRSFHYPECSDTASVYKAGSHRHCPEINRNFLLMSALSNSKSPEVIFTPHLAPMNRGILSTIYIHLNETWQAEPQKNITLSKNRFVKGPPDKNIMEKTTQIREIFSEFYKNEPFVRILPEGLYPSTNRVRHSNFCDVSVQVDCGGKILIITTAIDNMIKGAAGQAVQNMNILMDFKETCGLDMIPALF